MEIAGATALPSMSWNEISGAGCSDCTGINSPGLAASFGCRHTRASGKPDEPQRDKDRATPPHKTAPSAPALRHDRDQGEPAPAAPPDASRNSLWGGRFAGGPAAIMQRINASIEFDKRLYAEDIAGSEAHCAMLVMQKILSAEDGAAIAAGLAQIRGEIDAGNFVFREEHEDIHMNIEARLAEIIGAATDLHGARAAIRSPSISGQVQAIDRIDRLMRDLLAALLDQAEAHADTVMPVSPICRSPSR